MSNKRNFWCYRIDTDARDFFKQELHNGRLRQGWGWLEGQDLRNLKVDEGAKRNIPMFERVKKGDILLVPRLPEWNQVAIVEATEDWDKGYRFEISEEYGDYGHIFPAILKKSFVRKNKNVDSDIRSTLKNPSRFWNINQYQESVERILQSKEEELNKGIDFSDRLSASINDVINAHKKPIKDDIFKKLNEQFGREEWEYALVEGFRKLFPFYEVTRQGGIAEKEHGTDILIKIPTLTNTTLGIAIQVKDYTGTVRYDVIQQINKSVDYWNDKGTRIIQKIVLFTNSHEDENQELVNYEGDVDFIFATNLKDILYEISINFIQSEQSL